MNNGIETGFDGLPTEDDMSQAVVVDWSLYSTISMGKTISSLDNIYHTQRAAAINHLELIRHAIEYPHQHHYMALTDLMFRPGPNLELAYVFHGYTHERPHETIFAQDRYIVSDVERGEEEQRIQMAMVRVPNDEDVDPATCLRIAKSELNANSRSALSGIEVILAEYYSLDGESHTVKFHPILELFLMMLTHWTAETEFYIHSAELVNDKDLQIRIFHNATPAAIEFDIDLAASETVWKTILKTVN